MESNWLEKLFINEAKPALNRHSGSGGGNAGSGGSSSGGAELNIAYGDTPPEDTSKLWVKCEKPNVLLISDLRGVRPQREILLNNALDEGVDSTSSVCVGTKIYTFGGYTTGHTNHIYRFDVTTGKSITIETTLPIKAHYPRCVAVESCVYIFVRTSGSDTTLRRVYKFDTDTETITTLNPTTYSGSVPCVVGTHIYLFGGFNGSDVVNVIQRFDTETEYTTTLNATLPTNRCKMAAESNDKIIYLFGGQTGYSTSTAVLTILRFDTETETVTTLENGVPTSTAHAYNCQAVRVGGNIYLFRHMYMHTFDTATEKFKSPSYDLPMDIGGSYSCKPAFYDDSFYFMATNRYRKDVWRIDLAHNELRNGVLHIRPSLHKNVFRIVGDIELGVDAVFEGNSEGIGEPVEAYLYKDGAWTLI